MKVGGLWPLEHGRPPAELPHRSPSCRGGTGSPCSPRTARRRAGGAGGRAARLRAGRRRCPHRLPKQGSAALRPGAGAVVGSRRCRSTCSKWRVPGARALRVARLIDAGEVDLCVADFLAAVPNVPLGAARAGRPLRAQRRAHDLEAPRARSSAARWRRVLLELEWRKMRRYEARACARAPPDRGGVRGRPRAPGRSWRPARASARSPPASTRRTSRPDGAPEAPAGSSSPVHGLVPERGRHAALPRRRSCRAIRREVPDVSLTVVGRNPSARLRAAAAAAGRRGHRHRRRRAAVRGRGRGLRRAAARRRRHAAQDLRGPGHGQGGGLHHGRRGGPAARPRRALPARPTSPADFAAAVRRAAAGSARPRGAARLGATPGRAAGRRERYSVGRRSAARSSKRRLRARSVSDRHARERVRSRLRRLCDGGLPREGGPRGGRRGRQPRTRSTMINARHARPIVEPGLGELLAEVVARGPAARHDVDARRRSQASDLALICVGTPGRGNGQLDVERASSAWARRSGSALRRPPSRYTVVLRSTVLPGTTERRAGARASRAARAARSTAGSASRSTRSSCARARRCATSPSRRSRWSARPTTRHGAAPARALRVGRGAVRPRPRPHGGDGEVRRPTPSTRSRSASPTRSATSARRSAPTPRRSCASS